MILRVGDPLPDLPVARADGTLVSLRDVARGEATLLIFLRHLG